MKNTAPSEILKEKLSERMSANPRYSVRAFARDLKILPPTLSRILNGKKGISRSMALAIAHRLNFNKSETEYFCNLAESCFGRSDAVRKIARAKLSAHVAENLKVATLTQDSFRVISDWYHFALVELLRNESARTKNSAWMAKRLGIPEPETKIALTRLLRLELISKVKNGYQVNSDTLLTTDGVPSEALRKFHKQVLEKAIAAITLQSVEERALMASFFAIDSNDLSAAKKDMHEFRERFIQRYSKNQGDHVYALSLQFFNLTPPNP